MKRLAIFSINSETYAQNKYILFLLKELKTCCDTVIVCISRKMEDTFVKEIDKYAEYIYRYDTYVDINRWKDVLFYKTEFQILRELDEVVFLNDSFFGPLYPLTEVFETMEQGETDFWGISVHGRMKKVPQKRNSDFWPRFIQTYFFVVKNPMLTGNDFLKFLKEIPDCKDYSEASENFEFIFTDYFEKKGYRWGVLVDTTEDENRDETYFMSFILFDLYELVSRRRYPFVPKVIFDIDFATMQNYHNGNDIGRVLKYISKTGYYSMDYIYENLITRINLHDLMVRLNLNYVISGSRTECVSVSNYAIFAHLYYEDLFDYCIQKILNVPENFDIYISTDTEEKAFVIRTKIERQKRSKVQVSVLKGPGRDLSALLVGFREYLMMYEIICFIHDKKSSQMDYETVGKIFHENLWENTLHSRDYIRGIMKKLEENKYLGVVAPPMIFHNVYFHTAIDAWTICFEKTEELAKRLGVDIRISKEKNPVALGSVFWCKTAALGKLFSHEFRWEDFPEEPMPVDGTISHAIERIFPYIAQEAGYYTAIAMTEETAAVNYNNYRETINLLMREIDQFSGVNTATVQAATDSLRKLKIKRKR